LNPAGDGVILVDAKARMLHVDAAAESMLREPGSVLRLKNGCLSATNPRITMGIDAAIRACTNPQDLGPPPHEDHLSFPCDRAGNSLTIRVQRISPGIAHGHLGLAFSDGPVLALLLTHSGRQHMRALAVLGSRWGLTSAESRLALEMMHGDGRAAAAARCGISLNTARTHLGRVFEKAGVQRQAELIRRMTDLGLG
jgi:DNA-binding CsgD family transcriptional regulator